MAGQSTATIALLDIFYIFMIYLMTMDEATNILRRMVIL
jgi:hypothetical protein